MVDERINLGKVLVIEDDAGSAQLIMDTLKKAGISPYHAASGSEAIGWLEEKKADLCLIDYSLPDMTGSKLIEKMEEFPPFIVITGAGDERIAVEMMKKGAIDYMVKDLMFLEHLPLAVTRALKDLANERQLAESREELKSTIEELNQFFNVSLDLLCIIDSDGNIKRVNPQWETTLGFTSGEMTSHTVGDLTHPEDRAKTSEALARLESSGRLDGFINRIRNKEGSYRWIEWRIATDGLLYFAAARDITSHIKLEDELRFLATTDPLTGVCNRRSLVELGESEFKRCMNPEGALSLVMIDIDNFKDINDLHGHTAGDEIIKMVVSTILPTLRKSDLMGRLGGDEFVILMSHTRITEALKAANRILASVSSARIDIEGVAVGCTVSLGVTELNRKDGEFTDVLNRADIALYRSKEKGRNRIEFE